MVNFGNWTVEILFFPSKASILKNWHLGIWFLEIPHFPPLYNKYDILKGK